ncbi:MAG: hypothetical protein VX347_00135 [Bacteroidota bacterium]|nr:hypothetical protein [Bacteroidota bacterium]
MSRNDNTIVLTLSKDNNFDDIIISNKISNFILNLQKMNQSVFKMIRNKLLTFGDDVKTRGGSFVIVSKIICSDDFNIVPTIQEAYDFIELEEIERQIKI